MGVGEGETIQLSSYIHIRACTLKIPDSPSAEFLRSVLGIKKWVDGKMGKLAPRQKERDFLSSALRGTVCSPFSHYPNSRRREVTSGVDRIYERISKSSQKQCYLALWFVSLLTNCANFSHSRSCSLYAFVGNNCYSPNSSGRSSRFFTRVLPNSQI